MLGVKQPGREADYTYKSSAPLYAFMACTRQLYLYTHKYTYVNVCVCVFTYVRTHAHTYTHTDKYIVFAVMHPSLAFS